MQPGEDCDYVRDAIANNKIGLDPVREGGAEVSLRFLDKDCRRATVTVGRTRNVYAAVLVDLPCIVETMKSWDKKGWWKVADISQMLLVLGRCNSDEEARNYVLPREVDKSNFQYAHGLTPPMHWVRKRRFRKRLNYKTIANVEEEVERLLREDEETERAGGEVTSEYVERARWERDGQGEDEEVESEPAIETVERVEEYEEYGEEEEDEDVAGLEGDLQAMFDQEHSAPASALEGMVVVTETESPAALTESAAVEGEDSFMDSPAAEVSTPGAQETTEQSSSDEDEEEDDDSEEEEVDEDALAQAAIQAQQAKEVEDLQTTVQAQRQKVAAISNQLLKARAQKQLEGLEEDLRMKRIEFGIGEGED